MDNNTEANGIAPSSKWKELTLEAVKEFVTSAVVIDDSPELRRKYSNDVDSEAVAIEAADDGLGEAIGVEATDDELYETIATEAADYRFDEADNNNDHNIYIQDMTSAFRKSNIPCSFILPKHTESEDDISDDIANAASHADILVLDWHLKDKSPVVALKALRKIAQKDAQQNGRVRLICIYTGEATETLKDIYEEAEEALSSNGLIFNESNSDIQKGRGEHHYLMVLQKQSVIDIELPDKLLEAMAELANGILPSFALAAIAALRTNAHHIASRFSKTLDEAYVANRLITDPPEDVDELMRSLATSEFDSALGLERVADRFLGRDRIASWLEANKIPKRSSGYVVRKDDISHTVLTDQKFLSDLNTGYLDGNRNKIISPDGQEHSFDEKHRVNIGLALHEGENPKAVEEATMATEGNFAKLVSLKREAHGKSKLFSDNDWRPSLTLGTLLRSQPDQEGSIEYLYCLTPACDTVRLRGKNRGFVFLKLEEVSKKKGKKDLIVPLENDAEVKLRVDLSPWYICTHEFKGDENIGRVLATKEDGDSPEFIFESESTKFQWLGEVRHDRAMRDMAELNRAWMRLGIMDSEYLRLASKGVAPL